ncbi:hypothetical protein LLH06_01430 [Mucilaginibacter daejeonensis]|uniref:hypothetical protein n=1 Tax=Mucilaginibacter daejeonensis TaxID=398049 RepID=UPI001D16FC26|nr:hypothetical protein [Mucilaginibacter daejeonensis]UEG53633.1 hypothetical protein LLH06_01430 [Mucilaginibacter daejeonensis]
MTALLLQLHSILKRTVLTYTEAQQIDTEDVNDKAVHTADMQLRIIANKHLPFAVHELMQHIQVLDAIEFGVSEISVQYLVQVVASMANYPQIWEQCLNHYGRKHSVNGLTAQIDQLCEEAHDHYMVLSGFMNPA